MSFEAVAKKKLLASKLRDYVRTCLMHIISTSILSWSWSLDSVLFLVRLLYYILNIIGTKYFPELF